MSTVPPERPSEHDTVAVLDNAIRLLESARRQLRVSAAAQLGLGIPELITLEAVGTMPGLTPKALSLELSLTTGSITALLDRLTAAGYLARVPNPADRRSVLLHLTPTGVDALGQATRRYTAASTDVAQACPTLAEPETVDEIARAAAIIIVHTLR